MRSLWTLFALVIAATPVFAQEAPDEVPGLAPVQESMVDAVDYYFAAAEGSAEKPWKIEGAFGFTFKDGNTDLINFAGRALIEKRWEKDLFRVTVQSIYSEEEKVETASEHIAVQRYEHYLGEKHRLWQQLWLETDSQEALSLRIILTAGYGYRFVKNEKFELWGELGAGWEGQTFYGGTDKNEGILQFTVTWTWQITDKLLYEQVFIFWPSLSDSGEYKFVSDSKFSTPISDRWSLVLIIQDKYDSNPEPGIENNDFTMILTLSFDFTKKEEKK